MYIPNTKVYLVKVVRAIIVDFFSMQGFKLYKWASHHNRDGQIYQVKNVFCKNYIDELLSLARKTPNARHFLVYCLRIMAPLK